MTLGVPIVINGGIDALTGKKKQYTLTSDFLTNTITWITAFYETDNVTPAQPAGSNKRQQATVTQYESRFDIGQTLIDTTSKLFTSAGSGVVASISPVTGGTGYVAGTRAVTGGTGSGLTVAITVTGGVPNPTATIVTAGSGYTIGDVLTIIGGTATITITGVNNGVIPNGSVYLSDYFLNKVITTYPSVGQNDISAILVKGWFKEVMAIMEQNNLI